MNDRKRTARYGFAFIILAVLLVILFIWNVNAGSIPLSVREILNIIFRHQGTDTAYNIIWEIRLPRILAVIILGGALSVSGFLLQTFFNNPIAGPFVLGISSGAKLVVASALPSRILWSPLQMTPISLISITGHWEASPVCPGEM